MAHRLSNEEIDLTNVYGFFTKDEVAQEFTINVLFQVNKNCLDLGVGAGLEKWVSMVSKIPDKGLAIRQMSC